MKQNSLLLYIFVVLLSELIVYTVYIHYTMCVHILYRVYVCINIAHICSSPRDALVAKLQNTIERNYSKVFKRPSLSFPRLSNYTYAYYKSRLY
jgi:hypothetical protein